MIRVGLYTGNVYSEEDYKNGKIKECAYMFDDISTAEKFKNSHWRESKRQARCAFCKGCEIANAKGE